jgi:hypothetical protein
MTVRIDHEMKNLENDAPEVILGYMGVAIEDELGELGRRGYMGPRGVQLVNDIRARAVIYAKAVEDAIQRELNRMEELGIDVDAVRGPRG